MVCDKQSIRPIPSLRKWYLGEFHRNWIMQRQREISLLPMLQFLPRTISLWQNILLSSMSPTILLSLTPPMFFGKKKTYKWCSLMHGEKLNFILHLKRISQVFCCCFTLMLINLAVVAAWNWAFLLQNKKLRKILLKNWNGYLKKFGMTCICGCGVLRERGGEESNKKPH